MSKQIILKIQGMHCTSCAMNIDGLLEDIDGVSEASANFARQEVKVVYNSEKVSEKTLIETIQSAGYSVQS